MVDGRRTAGAKVGHRKPAAIPRPRWRACQTRKSRKPEDTIAQFLAELARVLEECFRFIGHQMETNGRGNQKLPPVVSHDPSMDRHALERLGRYVVSRRVALGYRNRTDLATSLKFTVRTLADIEHGVPQGQPRHLRRAGKHAGMGTWKHRHHPDWSGAQRNHGRTAPPHRHAAVPLLHNRRAVGIDP
jgi:hypothetical protein